MFSSPAFQGLSLPTSSHSGPRDCLAPCEARLQAESLRDSSRGQVRRSSAAGGRRPRIRMRKAQGTLKGCAKPRCACSSPSGHPFQGAICSRNRCVCRPGLSRRRHPRTHRRLLAPVAHLDFKSLATFFTSVVLSKPDTKVTFLP